jgi:hypothetical protein
MRAVVVAAAAVATAATLVSVSNHDVTTAATTAHYRHVSGMYTTAPVWVIVQY